ncbi:MAG: N-acetylmuramoyl-L-alanine amidase [Cardiobacteriaceae bacterium]|nr:N-acetylmuramoyl-L-alanine amidase [Cardiobacteriaceae bacterium]
MQKIVVHCSASPNGKPLRTLTESAAKRIDNWHKARGFKRQNLRYNAHLPHIGYHFVIETDGTLYTGRELGETGAHVRGHNVGSVGICLVGTDKFTPQQWATLADLVQRLQALYPQALCCGHRDLSPDLDGDGTVEPHEWLKICPGFDVATWLQSNRQPLLRHVCEEQRHEV